jgi:hypothetical protein
VAADGTGLEICQAARNQVLSEYVLWCCSIWRI